MKHLIESLDPFKVYCGAETTESIYLESVRFSDSSTCEECRERAMEHLDSLPDEGPDKITSVVLPAISGEVKEIRVDSDIDLTSIILPESVNDIDWSEIIYIHNAERIIQELIVDPDKEEE